MQLVELWPFSTGLQYIDWAGRAGIRPMLKYPHIPVKMPIISLYGNIRVRLA